MIGFRSYMDVLPPSCSQCHAVLIKNPTEPTQSMCPMCGLMVEEEQVQKLEDEQNKPALTPKVSPMTKPILVQGKSRKRGSQRKLHDESGNEINQQDTDIMNDIAHGRHVKYYKETVYDSTLKDDKSKS